jgi:hypothetical protein
MLGYKPRALAALDLAALMPGPLGPLHTRWLREAETLVPRSTPGSCRSGLLCLLLRACELTTAWPLQTQ